MESLLRESPAVALLGPRQSGKTTLATSFVAARGGRFFNLELENDRLRLDVEWEERTRARRLVVLDEAHAWPELFPRLRRPSTPIVSERAASCCSARSRLASCAASRSRWPVASPWSS